MGKNIEVAPRRLMRIALGVHFRQCNQWGCVRTSTSDLRGDRPAREDCGSGDVLALVMGAPSLAGGARSKTLLGRRGWPRLVGRTPPTRQGSPLPPGPSKSGPCSDSGQILKSVSGPPPGSMRAGGPATLM